MISAGNAFLLTCCVPGVRVRHCPYSPHFLALRSSLISESIQQHYLPFSFPFLFLLRQSSQFSLGEFRPSDVPLNHAAYDGTLKVRSKGPLVHYCFECSFISPSSSLPSAVLSALIGLLTLLSRAILS
jgi:hypothetical protein